MGILAINNAESSRHYGGFRGVDFSNDHTQVNPSRLAYLVNMYKDYQSGQGEALEKIVGFRQRANFGIKINIDVNGIAIETKDNLTSEKNIFGIFYFKCKQENIYQEQVVVHCDNKLWLWRNYPNSMNIEIKGMITVPVATNIQKIGEKLVTFYEQKLDFDISAIRNLKTQKGEEITDISYNAKTKILTYSSDKIQKDDVLSIGYYEGVISENDIIYDDMNLHKSINFIFNNKLYILDGKNYLQYDGISKATKVQDNAYIPTTYINIIPEGEKANIGKEYEQRNILTPLFKHTFIADGICKEFYLNENELEEIVEIKLYGKTINKDDYTVSLPKGKIIFNNAPTEPTKTIQIPSDDINSIVYYSEGYAGVEVTAKKNVKWIRIKNKNNINIFDNIGVTSNDTFNATDLINNCTLCTTFDGRVFLTGNSYFHNYVFYCGRDLSGYVNPSYIGVLNYIQDGVGMAPITGIMCVSDTLMILKGDTQQDSSVFFHSGRDNDDDLIPRTYPSIQGLSGLGCVGACCNFLDDPMFISRLGVEGISQLKIASERANEHRSRLIDSKLVNSDIYKAVLEEWGGYLCVLVDGKIFLADSRQRYEDNTGTMQYEWYYLEDIGVWEDQYIEYRYSEKLHEEIANIVINYKGESIPLEIATAVHFSIEGEIKDLRNTIANPPNESGVKTKEIYNQAIEIKIDGVNYIIGVNFAIHDEIDVETSTITKRHAYLCESKGNYTGGIFKKAMTLKSINDNLFFGTTNGIICSFNFDKRDISGEIPSQYYSFDGRTIFCGCATLMDNCSIPHLTKSTIKRSTVIKTKSFRHSSAKIKVRTNKKAYTQIARINNSIFSFEDMDFTDFTFSTTEQSIFAIKEKEKQWVEKQFFIFSDEFIRPFALYSISFSYKIAGRIK